MNYSRSLDIPMCYIMADEVKKYYILINHCSDHISNNELSPCKLRIQDVSSIQEDANAK